MLQKRGKIDIFDGKSILICRRGTYIVVARITAVMLPLLVAPELADPCVVLMFVWVYTPAFVVAAVKEPGWITLMLASIVVSSAT